jgi:hypothetical protein
MVGIVNANQQTIRYFKTTNLYMTTDTSSLAELKELVQSSFMEKYEGEEIRETNAGITKYISEYQHSFNEHYERMLNMGHICVPLYDHDLITNSTAFMLGPVCLYEKTPYAAESIRCKSLTELKHLVQDRKYLLYYAYVSIKTCKVDPETCTAIPLETPELEFIFRGAFINEL